MRRTWTSIRSRTVLLVASAALTACADPSSPAEEEPAPVVAALRVNAPVVISQITFAAGRQVAVFSATFGRSGDLTWVLAERKTTATTHPSQRCR